MTCFLRFFVRAQTLAMLAVGLASFAMGVSAVEAGCKAKRTVARYRATCRERGRVVSLSPRARQLPDAGVVLPVAPVPSKVVPTPQSVSPTTFTSDLNALRAAYRLPPVAEDGNLAAWANVNNGHQASLGMGHHVMGPARRQNAGWGPYHAVWRGWLASGPHLEALVDPTITRVGIAQSGPYWTFNAQ